MIDFLDDMLDTFFHGVDDAFDGPEAPWTVLGLLLLISAGAITIHTYLRCREQRLCLRDVLGRSIDVLWLLPVIAVAIFVVRRTSATLEPARGEPNSALVVSTDVPYGFDETNPLPIAAQTEPSWIREDRVFEPHRTLVTVSSRQFATIDEAEMDALTKATDVLAEDVEQHEPRLNVFGSLPYDLVERVAVRGRFVETITRATETTEFTVHRVHLQVELSGTVRSQVAPVWTARVAEKRLVGLAALAAFLTLAFGTLSGYLRLDDLSQGRFRGRLRFAAAALVTAGGLFASAIV